MNDTRSEEMREAMLALLSTAASMGIDIDELCHLAADELLSEDVSQRVRPYAAGAVFQLGVCVNILSEPTA